MKRLISVTILATAGVWAVTIIAMSVAAPDAMGRILPFLGGGVAFQLIALGNLAARAARDEKKT